MLESCDVLLTALAGGSAGASDVQALTKGDAVAVALVFDAVNAMLAAASPCVTRDGKMVPRVMLHAFVDKQVCASTVCTVSLCIHTH